MGKTLPALARTVLVGSTAYTAGSIPPLAHARKITNKRNWEGGEVPDFENGGFEDGPETEDGVHNSDAANAGRTGLPGFAKVNPADTSSAEATGAAAVDGEGRGDAANAEANDDPEGTGVPGAGPADGSDPGVVADTGTAPADTEGEQGGTDAAPARTSSRRSSRTTANS